MKTAVLVPLLVTAPVPLIAFATVIASLRLNANVPLLTTAPVPSDPVVPPLPICNVPVLIVVVPAYVLAPVKVIVPAPVFVTAPVPLMALATVSALLRLKASVPLLTTAPVPRVPGRAAAPDLQGAGVDRRRPGVGVGARQDGRPRPALAKGPGSADGVGHRHRVVAIEDEGPAVGDRTGSERARRAAIANLQRAGGDGGRARVGVGARQDGRASSRLPDGARAADRVRDRDHVAAIERERRAVDDGAATERPGRATVANLQRAGGHSRRPGVAVRAREDRGSGARLGHVARAADVVCDGQRVAAVEAQRRIVDDGAGAERADNPAAANLQNSRRNRRRAAVSVCSGKRCRSGCRS